MKATQQSDVIKQATDGNHVSGRGKNFQPLIGAGSWIIRGFRYGYARCACCGRPIRNVLKLRNMSYDPGAQRFDSSGQPLPQDIEIGIVCGPKVFTESCVGFYDDPAREWDRQHRAWKDYIDYAILCVRNADIWERVPQELRCPVDDYLKEGYETDPHSGRWWAVKDAKKLYLKTRRPHPAVMPDARALYLALRTVVYAAKKFNIIPLHWVLRPDMTLSKDESPAELVGG